MLSLTAQSLYAWDGADTEVLRELLPAFLCDRSHARIPARNGRTTPSRPSC
jgi:hypothetical protein